MIKAQSFIGSVNIHSFSQERTRVFVFDLSEETLGCLSGLMEFLCRVRGVKHFLFVFVCVFKSVLYFS